LNHTKSHTSHSPPPIAPPDPPLSTITPPDSIAPIRPIIMALPPSKRASSQHDGRQVQPSLNKYMDIDNAYLSKEITEIIAARRRQERAWHYVREVIACLAASNNAPKPPKIPIASRPNKMKSSYKTNAVKQNQPLIATPKHIICPNLQNVQAEIVEPIRSQKPTRFGKPTKEQLNAYLRAGDREYQAVVRANAAEARATIAENLEGANETPSSIQDTIISVENTNETPAQTQAGEEMRL
ncbi:hypothetical protein EPUL_005775, partial [Erysiphe pulchra]